MLPKTYKLQLSTLLSEHIGPGTCDGCQLKAQHSYSSRKMEAKQPWQRISTIPFTDAVKAASNCVPSLAKEPQGKETTAWRWFFQWQGYCPTEDGHTHSSWQR